MDEDEKLKIEDVATNLEISEEEYRMMVREERAKMVGIPVGDYIRRREIVALMEKASERHPDHEVFA